MPKTVTSKTAMSKTIDRAGFTPPSTHPLGRESRTATVAELVTTVALALSTIVAATAVSIGIARADVVGQVGGGEASLFGTAPLMGLVFVAMGGIAFMLPGRRSPPRQRQ